MLDDDAQLFCDGTEKPGLIEKWENCIINKPKVL